MGIEKEQVANIERLEIMEEKCGITIEGLNAEITHFGDNFLPNLNVYGEIHSVNGANINEDLEIIATAFNENGKVIGTVSKRIAKEGFFVLEALNMQICDMISKPAKIRVYPKIN